VTPEERRKRIRDSVRKQVERRGLAVNAGVVDLLGTLAQLQEEIRQTLAGEPTEFQVSRLPALLAELDRHIERWTRRAVGVTDRLIEEAWERGPAMIDAPLAAAEIRIGGTILPRSLLEELQGYTADKIKGVAPVARRRIENHVRLGLLGGQSPHLVMEGVGRVVDGPGPMKFVTFRAETITRTEMGRVHSAAADRRHQAAAKLVPGLGKEWLWSGKSRALHRAINGQKRAVGEAFELPDGVKMQYPRAAGAPVEHVANCGCESVPWMAGW
jgi:hypothetical protein